MAPLVPPHQELLLHANPDLLVLLETVLFVVMDSTQREAHVLSMFIHSILHFHFANFFAYRFLDACRSELPHVTRSLGWMLSHGTHISTTRSAFFPVALILVSCSIPGWGLNTAISRCNYCTYGNYSAAGVACLPLVFFFFHHSVCSTY